MNKKIVFQITSALFFLVPAARAQNDKILELGKETFATCSLCHGLDGTGAKAGDIVMAPSLLDSAFVKSAKAEPMVAVILKGIEKEDNKYLQQMVPLEAALTDEQLAAVATYVRKEFGGSKGVVKPNEVKRWRGEYDSQSKPWKRSELAQVVARAEAGEMLSKVKYSVYEGKWTKLPDFSTMEPVQRGEVKNGKISLDVAKGLKDNFGIVFEGDLIIKNTDTYEFSLHSDDGSALIIDGENVILHDGIHPGSAKTAKEKLEAGQHTFKLLYFEAGGGEELGLSVTAKSIGEVALSKEKVKKGGKNNSYPPIILKPENGEAIVHRAFLPGAKPRAIGVGYPGGINLVWDADTLNLSYVWRGDFMDVSPHWNARGSGSKPVGEPPATPAEGMSFQQLGSLDETWIPFSEAKIKYERDNPDPKKEMTFNIKHPDFQFHGYRLDKKRFPTFLYTYKDLSIADTFSPAMAGGKDELVRNISIKGKGGENTYFRISNLSPGEPVAAEPDWIKTGNMSVKIEGAEPTFRQSGGAKEVLAHIKGDTELKITYRWNEPRKPVGPAL